MTTIQISSELADKLTRLAKREHKTIDEVLEKLLDTESIEKSDSEDADLPGGAALLKAIRSANINSGTTDTAERSREILNTEFPKHLLNRMNNDSKE
ncbi:MAG: hypothetical protein GC179_02140 [Anaerolineaceae bacterium]|nr:hypothetical protein [Anaerolineaceae bacterium]